MGRLLGLSEPGTPAAPLAGTYEFNQFQNHTFTNLAKAMKFVGIFTVVMGVIYGVAAVIALKRGHAVGMIVGGVQCAIDIVLGLYLVSAAANCKRIVETQGMDIPNLMSALEQLRRYFTMQMVLIIIALCTITGGLLLYLVL